VKRERGGIAQLDFFIRRASSEKERIRREILEREEASSRSFSLSHAMDRDSRSYSCGGCERTAAEGRAMPME